MDNQITFYLLCVVKSIILLGEGIKNNSVRRIEFKESLDLFKIILGLLKITCSECHSNIAVVDTVKSAKIVFDCTTYAVVRLERAKLF